MKKLIQLFLLTFLCTITSIQAQTYFLMEMMDVDQEDEAKYLEVEEFWSKIHQERATAGEILGWDLWTFQPAGTEQGYRFMTVTLFDNPVDMFKGMTNEGIMEDIAEAYPNMSEKDINEILDQTMSSRDIALQIYCVETNSAGDISVSLGTYASLAWMKTNNPDYERMEEEVLKPMYKASIEDSNMQGWSLINCILPNGLEAYASHVEMKFFENLEQCIVHTTGETKPIEEDLQIRYLKSIVIGHVIMSIR